MSDIFKAVHTKVESTFAGEPEDALDIARTNIMKVAKYLKANKAYNPIAIAVLLELHQEGEIDLRSPLWTVEALMKVCNERKKQELEPDEDNRLAWQRRCVEGHCGRRRPSSIDRMKPRGGWDDDGTFRGL